MNCSRFRSKLESLAERRSSLSEMDDEVRDHLSGCHRRECREAWLELCLLDQAIGEWAAGFAKPDLGERIVCELRSVDAGRAGSVSSNPPVAQPARVHLNSTTQPDRSAGSRWIVVAVALLVLVSLIAIVTSQPRSNGPAPRDVMAENGTAPVAPRRLAEADLSSAYLALAEDATQFLTDTVALTLAGEEEIDDPTPAADWIHRVQDRVGPWGDEFDAALDRFLGTLPDSDS
jgi:hypothetical protein